LNAEYLINAIEIMDLAVFSRLPILYNLLRKDRDFKKTGFYAPVQNGPKLPKPAYTF